MPTYDELLQENNKLNAQVSLLKKRIKELEEEIEDIYYDFQERV